jgi:AcrR family transcriptional regulator
MSSAPPRGRPRASSREAIESVAVDLFLRDGYSQTTIAAIARASGVSTTTFFRYFSSKAEIVWAEFDAHTQRLRARLESDDARGPILATVRAAVVETLRTDLDPDGLSMRRFQLFDGSAELRGEESEHWRAWADSVAEFVARRTGLPARAPLPSAIGGAVQASILAVLRGWTGRAVDAEAILRDLDEALVPICDALEPLLTEG